MNRSMLVALFTVALATPSFADVTMKSSSKGMNVRMSGDGPMKAVFEKMGNISITTTVNAVETGAIAASLFAVPAGYTLKEQK